MQGSAGCQGGPLMSLNTNVMYKLEVILFVVHKHIIICLNNVWCNDGRNLNILFQLFMNVRSL